MWNSKKNTKSKAITRLFKKDGRTGKVSEIFNSGEVDTSYLKKLKPRTLTACPHCWETHHCLWVIWTGDVGKDGTLTK